MQTYHLSGPTVLNEKFMIKMWREITDFFYVQKIKIWFLLLNGRSLNDMNVCLGRVHAASYNTNRIGGVMVRVLASSAVDRGFEPRSGHTKD
jgi:hypothetical protein